MITKNIMTLEFYQNLGKLFYAIATVDNFVRKEELDKLKEIVKKEWLTENLIEDTLTTDAEASIINTFKWLQNDEEYNAEACFNSFMAFKKEQEHLFTSNINTLIFKTARAIASSFSGVNKGELILLTKLQLELNKEMNTSYYFTTITTGSFEAIEAKVMTLLQNEDFGLITQIDMQQTLKNKLQVDFKKYKILGACNPSFAYKALQVENKIGTMLPCNIIVQEISPNTIEVSAINPLVSMQAVKNDQLKGIALIVSERLENIINNINNEK
jgi:uncharacterized protein (DUF302 family)